MVSKYKSGDTRISQNGYSYTYVEGRGWVLTHRLIAEEGLGRRIRSDERVVFLDKDRTNLDPSNIEVRIKKRLSKEERILELKQRIVLLQHELEDLVRDDKRKTRT